MNDGKITMPQLHNAIDEMAANANDTLELNIRSIQAGVKHEICVRWVLGDDGLWMPVKYPCAEGEKLGNPPN